MSEEENRAEKGNGQKSGDEPIRGAVSENGKWEEENGLRIEE